jgi:putative hydrolase of the HAD superfamily
VTNVILFDLGGTLARYYDASEFPPILDQAIMEVQRYLDANGLLKVDPDLIRRRVRKEDHESADYRSRPLEERLTRIFGLEASSATNDILREMCKRFMRPIFEKGRVYEDTLPTLKELRSRGLRTAIVSNTSWGSPAILWRHEIKRLGLDSHMDSIVLDLDVGWRKPSERIFRFAMKSLGVTADECLFVGDEPNWDLRGPRAVGMEAVLLDRKGVMVGVQGQSIRNLHELVSRL